MSLKVARCTYFEMYIFKIHLGCSSEGGGLEDLQCSHKASRWAPVGSSRLLIVDVFAIT